MANDGNDQQVARILYKEIVEGDRRKILAQSNDSATGGGARDFRFGSYPQLIAVIKRMFPQTEKTPRKRGGKTIEIEVFRGVFFWQDRKTGAMRSKASFFEPPTDVRPTEGRIVRVHEYGCFDTALIPRAGYTNRVLLLLIQRMDGNVWPHFVTEESIRTPGAWDAAVAKELISCLDAKRPEHQTVIGFRDFTNSSSYCNGK